MRAHHLVILTVAVAACGGGPKVQPWEYSPRPMADTLPIWQPDEREVPLLFDFGYQSMIRPIAGSEGGGEAMNLTAMDDVVNSTWFTHRNGREPLSADQIRRGPRTIDGPAEGTLTITSIKTEGITPGFNVRDAAGNRWIIKFDPPEHPELASSAEVIATQIFWAAGYNTPENFAYDLDPSRLVLGDDVEAMFPDEDGVLETYAVDAEDPDERLTMALFEENILDRFPRQPNGRIRVLASRFLSGIPIGPFDFMGNRRDDPNDVVPHQHRRELRGLYVLDAWLNQTDAKQGNTLDMFIPAPGSPVGGRQFGHVRHHLIDFGSALGSAAVRPMTPRHGSENEFDLSAMGKRLVTIGLYRRPWQKVDDTSSPPSTGYYDLEPFRPGDWRPNLPNPAFDNRTPGDGFWGAKIVMSFTDPQLFAAVEAGRYSNPAAARYVLDGLKARRDATGRYWFAQTAPIDDIRLETGSLTFEDLWIRHFGGPAQYRYALDWDAPDPDLETDGVVSEPRIPLPAFSGAAPSAADPQDRFAQLQVWKIHADGQRSARPATIWLEWTGQDWNLVGVRH